MTVALLSWHRGPAFAVFLLQALIAVRLLEAVNYFEHYGLVRRSRRVQPVDSWDTDSAFTLYTLVGLSRHADHHAYASRPYQQLRHFDDSPKLPYGYFGTVVFLIVRNKRFLAVMEKELQRRQLGPYAGDRCAGDSVRWPCTSPPAVFNAVRWWAVPLCTGTRMCFPIRHSRAGDCRFSRTRRCGFGDRESD
jgi:hypothetical protein